MIKRHLRIPQRIRQNFANRDWFGVGVEVFAVVLGVLLALQANSWAEDRRADRERAALVDRLVSDLKVYASDKEDLYEMRTERLQRIVFLEEAIADNQLDVVERDQLRDAVRAVFSYDDVRPLPISFQEMLSSGSLDRLDNPEARSKLEILARQHAKNAYALEFLNSHDIQHNDLGNAAHFVSARNLLDHFDDYDSLGVVDLDVVRSPEFLAPLRDAAEREGFMRYFDLGLARQARLAIEELEK